MEFKELSKRLTLQEGKKVSMTIAQVDELLKIIIDSEELGYEVVKRWRKKHPLS